MKKNRACLWVMLLSGAMTLLFSILLVNTVRAADSGSCTYEWRPTDAIMHMQCTATAGGALSVTLPTQPSASVPVPPMVDMNGKWLQHITVYPGGTAPADDKNLGIVDSRGQVFLTATLASHGLTIIDTTDTESVYPDDGTNSAYYRIRQDYPLTISSSALGAAAIINIDLEF